MKHHHLKKSVSALLALSMMAATVAGTMSTVYAGGDTLPARPGEAGYKGENQPSMHGHRAQELLDWSPETDQYAEFMRAQVPQQDRIAPFAQTQANPLLVEDVKSLQLTSDYGNGFFNAYQYNDQFSDYCFNFWQYVDYTASWHGMVTESAPDSLFDPEAEWWERHYEFGTLNMPNPAYTNAAHKNGSQSLGCIFFPRGGQHTQLFVYKDENGNFPVADKLIELANYYGFDGYFINAEEQLPADFMPLYDEFVSYMTANGMYIQVYASNPYGQNNQGSWGGIDYYNKDATVFSNWIKKPGCEQGASSLYMNPDPSKSHVDGSVAIMESLGLDARNTVFNTLEAGQTGFSGTRGSLYNTYDENLVPRTGIASLGASMVYTGMDEQLFGHSGANNYDEYKRGDPDYQKYVFSRERTFWSGSPDAPMYSNVNADEELLGKVVNATADPVATANDPTRGGNAAGKPQFRGMSAFISERSVVGGSTFYTNFNTGHGMQYFVDGEVSNDNQWANINIQDILPSWQWWIDTEGTRLHAEFDYGEKYNKNQLQNYTQVGGYNGGSSLVVNGTLDEENTLRLYKTDLSVNENTKVSVTYNKASATDSSKMELAVIFKNDPNTVVTFNVPQSGQQTDGWVTKEISLGDYAGEEIAVLGFNFDPGATDIENYQMNIGELKVTDGTAYTPEKPTGFKIDKAYDTQEMYLSWDLADYNDVQKYNVYAEMSDGREVYLGGTYDDVFYVKSLYGEEGPVTLKLTAVGKDGTESEAAELVYDFSKQVKNLQVEEKPGYLEATWENAADLDCAGLRLDVNFEYSDKEETYSMTVDKDATSAKVMVPVADGTQYTLSVSAVDAEGNELSSVEHGGRVLDLYSDPYTGHAIVNGKGGSEASIGLSMSPPENQDWWKIRLYKDGQMVKEHMREDKDLPSASEAEGCDVVLVDYSGNVSEPRPFQMEKVENTEITREMIPDEALFNAVTAQAGTTVEEAAAFAGTLDLSGTNVKDLTGINLLTNVTAVNLTDCKELTEITEDMFDNMQALKQINITGCSGLQTLKITGTSADELVYGDAASFENLLFVDLSNNRFDFSEGTPERAFVDAVQEQIDNYDGPAVTVPVSGNVALNGSITADTVDDWNTNFGTPANIIDGNTTSEASAAGTIGAYMTVDLGAPMPVNKWVAYLGGVNGANCYPGGFTVLYSNDNKNFTELESITEKVPSVERTLQEPVEARYWRIRLDERAQWSSIVTEFELYADSEIEIEPSVEYSGQNPALYPNVEEKVLLEKKLNGEAFDPNAYYEEALQNAVTNRGTSVEEFADAEWIAEGYNPDTAMVAKELHQIKVTDANGNVTMDSIPTNEAGTYTVEYITFAENGLETAMYTQQVIVKAVTSVLEKVVAEAEQMKADGALENTMEAVVEEFNAALQAAKDLLAKEDATQAELNAAAVRLVQVMNKVDWKQGDKTILEVAVDVALSINENLDQYVEEGKQEFVDALANAQALLESGNAWQDDIDAATDALIEAMANLRMAPNKDILNDMIEKAEGTDLSGYTEDSAALLNAALENAKAVAANGNATQDEVDAAADTLNAALNGLVFVNGDNDSDADTTTGGATTTPAGDGSTPTKTGDAGVAGIAALAVLSAGALIILKKRK